MRRRALMAVGGALLLLGLDGLAFAFPPEDPGSFTRYAVAGPACLGEDLLLYGRTSLGWPIAEGASTPFSLRVSVALIVFNWLCYAALGGVAGWMLGGVLWKDQ